jgi:hypothetical protein
MRRKSEFENIVLEKNERTVGLYPGGSCSVEDYEDSWILLAESIYGTPLSEERSRWARSLAREDWEGVNK